MVAAKNLTRSGAGLLVVALALGGCGKIRQKDPQEAEKKMAQAKVQKAACASATAYDRLKGAIFDQAIGAHRGDRANLDVLADYSIVRMEDPVVKGWDPGLDITRCAGHFILEIPPGAERAFGGARRLQADIEYTAQAAADGNGFVYQQKGAEPIVAKLAAFDLSTGAYRPPPAIDDPEQKAAAPTAMARADMPLMPATALPRTEVAETKAPAAPAPAPAPKPAPKPAPEQSAPRRQAEQAPVPPERPAAHAASGSGGEAAIRAFYGALGSGNGAAASARIIPEKRSSGAYSPAAMTRFYGKLPEPIRLTGVVPLAGGAYRVTYRYSAGRSRCQGGAVVRVTRRGGRDLIRSIQALNGC